MKIIVITYNKYKTGGIEQVANNIVNSLNDSHEVQLIAIDDFKLIKSGVFSQIFNRVLLNIKIKRYIKKLSPDILISMHPFLLARISLTNRSFKLITWVHGIDVFGINGIKHKENLEKSDKIIAVSNFTKNHLINDLAYKGGNIEVINNCVDIETFQYTRPSKHINELKLLTIGRLSSNEQYKGHDLVIKSINKTKEYTKQIIKYTIVGDGDDRERLEALVEKEKVERFVIFTGKVSFKELLEEYRKCDVFIMPSFFKKKSDGTFTGEGFGIVYVEAGAIGRPVIGCTIGGQTDCIIDDYNGKLVESNSNDIAEKIAFMANNESQRINMGENNRKLVEEKFSFKIFQNNILNLINTI